MAWRQLAKLIAIGGVDTSPPRPTATTLPSGEYAAAAIGISLAIALVRSCFTSPFSASHSLSP